MSNPNPTAQSLAVKRAQVEFHNFASLGEPERALGKYTIENQRRGEMIARHAGFIGGMTPFLEIGANVGHTSYLLANHFGAGGFALDISADALRHGKFLMDHWSLERAPVRMGGDALNLPFKDASLRFVMTHQTLSQFLDIEAVFREVMRVLQPGGVFYFSEEPIRRILSLRLYRCPYYNTMKPWERKLYDWGLLGFVAKDVIGAHQEESFGIRQNHRMRLADWHAMVRRHFAAQEYEIHVTETGRVEHWVRALGRRIDKHGSDWVPARLLGGTLAAFCRKAGTPTEQKPMAAFETFLRCPDCSSGLTRRADETLVCPACGYEAPDEGGVYNLIRSSERRDLYPGDSPDTIDFSVAGHESKLIGPWEELEGVFGGKYRWLSGETARARLTRVKAGAQKIRIRGFTHRHSFEQGAPVTVALSVNGQPLKQWTLDRVGLFILEADVPEAPEYLLDIKASPRWQAPPDDRWFTVNLGMIRLVDREL